MASPPEHSQRQSPRRAGLQDPGSASRVPDGVPGRAKPMRSDREGPVAGVVLAAGSSSRMGQDKLLLRLDGESVLRRAVRRALAAGLDPVIVVLGHGANPRVRDELAGLAVHPVVNPDPSRGIQTSRQVGIAAVPREACAAVLLLADMPFVTEEMIAALVRRYRESTAPLVISEYGEVQAPPTLYGRSLFSELLAAEGDEGAKRVIQRHAGEAVVVAWPAAALADLDRPEDYERLRE
jgi:molybdenum cofactor cytidylyltransferase